MRLKMDPPPRITTRTPDPRRTLSIEVRPSIERATTELSWSLTPTPAPRESQFEAPATPAPATRPTVRPRIRKLTPADHLILMNHVCEHQGEFTSSCIAFWKTISKLFEEDTGFPPISF